MGFRFNPCNPKPDEVRGTSRQLRVVGIPVKTHPTMNFPAIGLTGDDPGKFVLGSVPVEEDGSALCCSNTAPPAIGRTAKRLNSI